MRKCTVACPALTTALCYVSIAATVGIAGIAEDFEASRVRTITGSVLDGETDVRLELKAASMRDGAKCVYGVKAANGRFSQAVKLFPGLNVPTAETATGVDQKLIRFSVKKPSLRVQLSWAGNNQDYDLHVNEVFYGNKISGGGTLDHDWIDNDSDGNPVENITYAAAEAGLYRIYVYYYDDNEYDEDGEQVGSPQTTTVRIYVNGKQIYSGSRLITEHNGDGTGDGKSIWNIGTVVLHSGDGAGGYAADGRRLDLAGQGGLKGVSPLTTFSAEDIAGPNEKDPVYLCVGDAAQFNATGTLNSGSGNEQPDTEIIEKFTSTDEAVGTIDALGVFVAKAPGHTQISCQGYSGNPIDVYVVKVDLVQWVTLDGNTPIENCPKNGGKRIFPDKQTPTDDNASTRKKVVVRAKVSPAVEGQTVHFRVIDVDDPSEDTQYVDKNDAAGPTGADNLGTGHSLSAEYAQTDASGFASVEFMVSMQPGDNFKVLASLDGSMLNSVKQTEVDDGSVPDGVVQSEMLTVWRRLWVERDSMSQIPDEERWITGYVEPSSVETVEDVNHVTYSKFSGTMIKEYSTSGSTTDEYEGGSLTFKLYTAPSTYTPMGPFYITRSKTLWGCDFEVYPALTTAQLAAIQGYQDGPWGVYFQAKDDGDYSVFDAPQYLSFGMAAAAYKEAYIEVVYADDYNQMKIQPYKREVTYLDLGSTVHGARDLSSSRDMWVARVLAAFEGDPSLQHLGILSDVDADPDGVVNMNDGLPPYMGATPDPLGGELLGITPAFLNVSVVFMETLRDGNMSFRSVSPGGTPYIAIGKVAIHEVTHSGGSYAIDHDDEGAECNLMNSEPEEFNQSDKFSPKTINALRNVETW